MKNNIRHKDNTNNRSVIIFLKIKNSQRCYFAWENLQWGFCDVSCCSSFHFDLHIVVVLLLHLSMFFHFVVAVSSFTFSFRRHLSPFRGLSPGFYTHFLLSAQPIAEWFATLSFFDHSVNLLAASATALSGHFYPQAFLTLRSFTDILIYVYRNSLGAGSSSLKFSGIYTDPRNTATVHLFARFTVIHKLHIQNDSVLNSTIY